MSIRLTPNEQKLVKVAVKHVHPNDLKAVAAFVDGPGGVAFMTAKLRLY